MSNGCGRADGRQRLDATRFGKQTMFNFARHRRPEHYGRIVAQTGVERAAE